MSNEDTTVNPKPIISLMYAVSVGFWAKELSRFVGSPEAGETGRAVFVGDLESWVALFSGGVFLLDLLCIVWWYARYIYRVQPSATFWMYFLDFLICSMFALAANTWVQPMTFLVATVAGSAFLGLRFGLLYKSVDASLTDKQIVRRACGAFIVALLIAVAGLLVLALSVKTLEVGPGGHALPGALAAIGIALTAVCWKKIDVAVDIYSASHPIKALAPLCWPKTGIPNEVQRTRIRLQVNAGLGAFDGLFKNLGRHDHIRSRVHAEVDLRIQSYILALPSCTKPEHAEEIREKAFMVAV